MRQFPLGSPPRGRWVCAPLLALTLFLPAWADEGVVSGVVTDPEGAPVQDARVILIERVRVTSTDEEGRYRFEGVPQGELHLQATGRGLGSGVKEIEVGAGETTVDLTLTRSVHREQIVVTATRGGRGTGEVIQPVQVLDDAAIGESMQPTLGETLSEQPGMSSTYYGPGSSRPIIRGQGGSRVRVLESGLGVGDASATSPDHAVSTDPFSAERIEILRGPATLLYGSTAVGGVVNIIDERILEYPPDKRLSGDFNLRYGSVADERAGALALSGGAGQLAWKLAGFGRKTGDYSIPGPAVRGDPTSPDGLMPNSALETRGGNLGLSWVGKSGFVGGSAQIYDTLYGVPAGDVRIDLQQKRYDLRGGFDLGLGRFEGIRFSLGATDYEHAELEGAEVGTRFFAENLEGRVEVHHGEGGMLPGVLGLQFGRRDLKAVGKEAFIPPSLTDAFAVFGMQEIKAGEMRYEVGLRFERQDLRADSICADGTPCTADATCAGIGDGMCRLNPDSDFSLPSGSIGLAWVPSENYTIGVSVAGSSRAPTSEELYSNGPHLATASFEKGDPTLNEETSLGVDLSLRKRSGKLTGEVNLYAQDYSDFIFEQPTGEIEDGLPVFRFGQTDARFAGFEVQALIELYRTDAHDFDLEIFGDYVRAENKRTDEDLPYLPPGRAGLGLHYEGARWSALARAMRVAAIDRVVTSALDDPLATDTPAYTMVTANVGYRFVARKLVHRILLRGSNLADEEARVNPSRLRDRAPLPGRDVSLSYRLVF